MTSVKMTPRNDTQVSPELPLRMLLWVVGALLILYIIYPLPGDISEQATLPNSNRVHPRHIPCSALADPRPCLPREPREISSLIAVGAVDGMVTGSERCSPSLGCETSKTPERALCINSWQFTGVQASPRKEMIPAPELEPAAVRPVSLDTVAHEAVQTDTLMVPLNNLTRCESKWESPGNVKFLIIKPESGINVNRSNVECRRYRHWNSSVPEGTKSNFHHLASLNGSSISSVLCYIIPYVEIIDLGTNQSINSTTASIRQNPKRGFEWNDFIHLKDCTGTGDALQACKQHQLTTYIMYFILGFMAFCGLSWIVFRCLNRHRNRRRAPFLVSYKSDSEHSLVSRPMRRIRAHGLRGADEEAVRSSAERFVGLDGTDDGWTKGWWANQKQRPKVRFSGDLPPPSPPPRFYTPRIPSLVLPRSTLATVRQLSGLVRGGTSESANTMREMRPATMRPELKDISRLRWGSTI